MGPTSKGREKEGEGKEVEMDVGNGREGEWKGGEGEGRGLKPHVWLQGCNHCHRAIETRNYNRK